MGLWSRHSPESLIRAETVLLSLACVRDQICIRDVQLSDGNFIHCVICGSSDKPPIVLLHGYCGGGMVFYRVIGDLSEDFHVYLVDLLGMGRSSRPPFTAKSPSEAESFFVESLEEVRSVLGLSQFVLLGHSFGGYIAGCYALAYASRISHLMLLSPIGVTEKPEDYSFERRLAGKSWATRAFWKALGFLWKRNVTPAGMLRMTGPLSKRIVKCYTRRRLTSLPPDDLDALEDYLLQVCLLPGSGEYSILQLLEPSSYAISPLSQRLPSLPVPMSFFYGERDWISPQGALQVKVAANAPVSIRVIPDAGHQLFMENTESLVGELKCALKNPMQSGDMSSWEVWSGK